MTSGTVGEALREAERRIGRADARALLRHVLGRDSAYLIAHADDALDADAHHAYKHLLARRETGEPVAYLTGGREFFSRDFKVTPAVLIPRPETELLVEVALRHIDREDDARVLELGTGSGCIGITLALERAHARVVAIDRAKDALAVAGDNARTLCAGNLELRESDWFAALAAERFDVIVSNPPYVARDDPHLTRGDLRFEPRHALEAGDDGLDCIRSIVNAAGNHLRDGAWLFLEHGYDQAEAVRALLESAGFSDVSSARDLADIERVSGGRLHRSNRHDKLMLDGFSRI